MFNWLKGLFGRSGGAAAAGGGAGAVSMRARYDLAQTTDGNRKHWAAADGLSAEAANDPATRQKLRERTRYEVANNSYVKGMVSTLANDTIGRGPRLQMTRGKGTDSPIEADFADWAREARLAKKLRIMRRAKAETGEVFAIVFTNPRMSGPVKLDVAIVEADRVTDTGIGRVFDPLWCDGIEYDDYGNPVSYRILKHHPGGPHGYGAWMGEADTVDAGYVFHYFTDCERPGQRRGVPELTPSIQTGAELRRFDNAVLRTAEVHARLALALQTDTVPEFDPGEPNPEAPEAMDTVEIPDSGAIVLPPGYKLNGVDSTQPTDGHTAFVNTKLREAARCINMPFTIAALDSSVANMSARYLDSQIYAAAIRVERGDLEGEFLDWLFLKHWVAEYALVKPNMPRSPDAYPHTWYWPSLNQHADPEKVATAQKTRLEAGVSSMSDEIAEDGQDWEDVFGKESRVLGVSLEEYRSLLRLKRFGTPNADGTPVKTDAADPAQAKAMADLERIKGELDAAGVGVRGGMISPQPEDETFYRAKLGAPPMGPKAVKAWADRDGDVRRPITLTQPLDAAPAAGPVVPGAKPGATPGDVTP